MKRNESIVKKTISPIKSWNWPKIITISLMSTVFVLYIGGFIYMMHSSKGPEPEQVEQVSVGMTQEELFKILEDKGWSGYDERGYHYSWSFKSPSGIKGEFLVIVKDSVVTDIATY